MMDRTVTEFGRFNNGGVIATSLPSATAPVKMGLTDLRQIA
jgi:hypothetical protein